MGSCTAGKMQRILDSGPFFQLEKMADERFRAFFAGENRVK
jgi:hypothetical protein